MALRRAFLCRSSSFHHPVTKSSLNLSSGFVDMKGKIKSLDCEKDRGSDEDTSEEIVDSNPEDQWSKMPPELLGEIVQRIETSEDRWPMRKNVVTCACVCKKWREITRAIVKSAHRSGRITFPSSLKEAGPRNPPVQCVIKRNKRTSTFYLYLGLTDSLLSGEKGKLLLAARRFRHGAHTEYVISLSADDLSQGSNAYVGKLSSDFLGSKFTIYDNQPPYDGARPAINRASRRKQICPQVPAGSFEIGKVSYKFNILRSRGPRRMLCKIQCPTEKETTDDTKNTGNAENQMPSFSNREAVLVNQPPRWHEQLQCWCLNFHGRVTVASVKNFQLIATVDPSQPESKGDNELVLLQFGKVGEDMFTMDYRQPLSAFHAFAICLTSFGTKIACE